MSVLTYTPDALRGYRAQTGNASHVAMIKRVAAFALAVCGFTLAAAAAVSLKVAIYLPHLPRPLDLPMS